MYLGQWLFAVADGLGGHVAGDVASATVVDTLRAYDRPADPAGLPAALGGAVAAANNALRRRIEADPTLAGMASTLVAMLCSGTTAALANVGDSRAYLRRGSSSSGTSRITEDHTFEQLVAHAAIVPNLPARLCRFLDGRLDGRSADITTWDLRPGDRFLLCSDGLSSFVAHDAIDCVVNSIADPGDAADRLVALAIDQGGGPDNVTVIIVDVGMLPPGAGVW